MIYFFRFLLLSSCLLSVADGVQEAAAAATTLVEETLTRASTGRLVLSRDKLWKRMLLSDFINDPERQIHFVNQANAARGDERIALLEQAALYGHIDSMIKLGQYYAMKGDGLESLRWYILGFEENWLANGTHHSAVLKILKGELAAAGHPLGGENPILQALAIKSITDVIKKREYGELFTKFRKSPKGFFDVYAVGQHLNSNSRTSPYGLMTTMTGFPSYYHLDRNEQNLRYLRFQVRLGELSLQAKGDTSNPWFEIGEYYKKSNAEYAQICFERSKTSMGFLTLGALFEKGRVGRTQDGKPDYHQAIENYTAANSPEGWEYIAILYYKGLVGRLDDGSINYTQAIHYLKKANKDITSSFKEVGLRYYHGNIDKIPGEPNHEEAKKCLEIALNFASPSTDRSILDDVHYNLGTMYHLGQIGAIESEPDLDQAIYHYKQSNRADAKSNLGVLLRQKPSASTDDFEEAARLLLEADTADSLVNLCSMYTEGSIGSIGEKLNYQRALYYCDLAIKKGSREAHLIYTPLVQVVIEELQLDSLILEAQTTPEEQHPLSEEDSSDEGSSETLPATAAEAAYAFAATERSPDTQAISASAYDSLQVAPAKDDHEQHPKVEVQQNKLSTREKQIERARKRFKEAVDKTNRHIAQFKAGALGGSTDTPAAVSRGLTIQFASDAVQYQFDEWNNSSTTLPELLQDIALKPWGIEGMGQPEVLKHKFMGHHGCFSRRIAGQQASGREDRLVYRVTGHNQINVLSVGGHYEKSNS